MGKLVTFQGSLDHWGPTETPGSLSVWVTNIWETENLFGKMHHYITLETGTETRAFNQKPIFFII